MPEPPSVDLWTRSVLENPYPLGIGLLALGAVIFWLGLRDGRADRMRIAVVPVLLGAATLVTGTVVVTAGEHARTVVSRFVDAVVEEDLLAATTLLDADVRLHLSSPSNPGYRLGDIADGLSSLTARYDITENRITMLDSFTESAGHATVHLGCLTEVAGGYGPTPTTWVLQVELQPDGAWTITRMTWVSVMGDPPRGLWLR
jgi:hypothetical protein